MGFHTRLAKPAPIALACTLNNQQANGFREGFDRDRKYLAWEQNFITQKLTLTSSNKKGRWLHASAPDFYFCSFTT